MKQLIVLILASISLLSSCNSSFENIQKSKDFAYKLTKADEYYDKKQYAKANLLYEELLTVYKGTKNFEAIYYKYAFTFYNDKNYLMASYHFKNFADLFPKSPKTEECEFLNSLCLYNVSSEYTLDQSNTIRSIGELQTFVNTHPESKKVKEANKLIDASRSKLEIKDNYSADLYFKIGEYRAASVAYEQIMRKYPDSKNVDFYKYMSLKASFKYASNSIPEKQFARFTQITGDYSEFVRLYPKSPYRSEVEKINSLSLQSLKKLASYDSSKKIVD